MGDHSSAADNPELRSFEAHELEEDADETQLAIAERLIAELLVRSWRRKKAGENAAPAKPASKEISRK